MHTHIIMHAQCQLTCKGVARIFVALRQNVLKCARIFNHAHLECPAAMMMIEQAFSRIYQRAQVNQVTR
jgi:hypothetical protein